MQKIAEFIIRPTKRTYDPTRELGPTMFTVNQKYLCCRTDFEVKNRRYKTLQCSLFHHNVDDDTTRFPLVVFCHGNSGNRTYSYEIVSRMLQEQISVLTFDFAGCGISEGKYVFQGFFEQYDIEDVLEYALEKYTFIDPFRIGIWGRSMGAIAALLLASHSRVPSLIIVDSAFKNITDVLSEYVKRLKVGSIIIPNMFATFISNKLRSRILQTCNFDFELLKPIEEISTCKIPALFHHTKEDQIVPKHHSRDLYYAYPAEKEYLETEGDHNSPRTEQYYETVLKFIKKVFARKRGLLESNLLHLSSLQPRRNLGEQDCTDMLDGENEIQEDIDDLKINSERETKSNRTQPIRNLGEQDCIETIDYEDEAIEGKHEIEKFPVGHVESEMEYLEVLASEECESKIELILNEDKSSFLCQTYELYEPGSRHLDLVIQNKEVEEIQTRNEGEYEEGKEAEAKDDDNNDNDNNNNESGHNENDILSSMNESSQYAMIDTEDMNNISKAMSEPDHGLKLLEPWKDMKIISAHSSFFQGS